MSYVYSSGALTPVPTATQTANYTANVNDFVIVDGTSGSPVITLPTTPPNFSTVGVKRYDATYTPANIPTVAPGGSDAFLGGSTTALQLLLQGQVAILQYNATTAQWFVRSTDEPLSQLDLRYEPLEQFAILPSAYTLTSTTSFQQLLNTTTNGAVTLPVGDYFFDCGFSLTGMSSTSGSFGFGFGGTAGFTQSWAAVAAKGGALNQIAPQMAFATSNTTNLITNTNTFGTASIRGSISVTTAGTLVPKVALSVAAAAVVGAGSYFRIQSVNSATSFAGAWS